MAQIRAFASFFYLGVPARWHGITLHSHTPLNATAPSGFPVQCFLPSHMPGGAIQAYATRPYVRAYRIRPPAKNISPSIPGATLVGTQSPFRGEAPDPLVRHHSRAAISAPLPIPTELLPLPGHPSTSATSATR